MALLTLKSDNPQFSYCIVANPSSPLSVKTFKKGAFYGYYINEQEYAVLFRDNIAAEQNTYKAHPDAAYEYLSINEYADARFINNAINRMFHTAYTGSEYDVVGNNSMTVFGVETNERVLSLFQKFFTQDTFEYETIGTKCFKVTISVNNTMSYLLKLGTVFSLFASIEGNDNFIYIEDDLTDKYINLLKDLNAPYFIRYVFKISMLRSEKRFEKIKPILEANTSHPMTFTFGDTHKARMDYIYNLIKYNGMQGLTDEEKKKYVRPHLPIVDIGTGYDFRYLKMLQKEMAYEGQTYYAIERDEDAYEKIKARVKSNAMDNVKLFRTFDEFLEQYNGEEVNVICTEVLEHNEKDEALKLFRTVLEKVNYSKAIFTTPNSEFNAFYNFEEGQIRHDDHKWEPTAKEFHEFVRTVTANEPYNVHFYNVGDLVTVDNKVISPTQLVLIKK